MIGVVITNHATIRYLERVKGCRQAELSQDELNLVKKEVIPDILIDALKRSGFSDGRYLFNGFIYVVKDNALVTICKKPKKCKR
jgi:hypothetical protein